MREPSPYFIRRTARPDPPVEAQQFFSDQPEESLDLWTYWQTVRRHLRLILMLFLGAILITAVHLSTQVPVYTAQATILIGPSGPNLVESSTVGHETQPLVASDYYTTQCDILKSRSLAARVIKGEGLENNPGFTGLGAKPGLLAGLEEQARAMVPSWSSQSRKRVAPRPAPADPDVLSVKPWLVDSYLSRLKITSIPDTSLVQIGYTTIDPKLSAAIANAHAEEYIRQGVEIHSQANREAEQFLQEKLVELKEQLQKSEIALNDYRREKGIIPGLMSLNGKDAAVVDRLADLSKVLTAARVARIGLEAQLELIHSKQYDSLPAVMGAAQIQGLESQLNELYAQNASLSNQFKPDYPPLAQLQAKLQETQERLNAEVGRVVQSIESAYQEAQDKENKLEAEMGRERTVTLSLNDAAVQYAILDREVDTNRQLYDSVLKGMKDVGMMAESHTSNVSIIDRAEPPGGPSAPRPYHAMLLAAVLGLVGGVALALLLDYLDNTFKSAEEVQKYLGLPALAVIPEFGSDGRSSRRRIVAQSAGEPSLCKELTTKQAYNSTLVEAYRNFRTALLLSRAGSPPKTTLITSATAREGKTVTAVNTAVMFAQLASRVLLVDADLRRPRCHQFFALDNRLGLTEVLTGASSPDELIRPTGLEHLFVLAAGTRPPNPTELLGSVKMVETLKHLEQHYDYIVIDSPPVMPVSDALLLSTIVDGVAVVADGTRTPRQQVKAACARLDYARAKVLGVVLNRASMLHADYYSYYSDYFSTPDEDRGADGDLVN
ncbi:MAG: polysaccharide biosynthesis tyrosine autokinase [Candidatus Binataceae bacterium]